MDGHISTWLAHQTWYAVALSSDIDDGRVHGSDFFGHRLAVFRDRSGQAAVIGGQCPHMGADLALGAVVGDTLQCMFHHFCFDRTGACTSIPSRDRIPAKARVPAFTTRERWGAVWIYNGDAPATDPPGIREYDDDGLVARARRTDVFPVEPWVILGNSFDFQHLRYVHGLRFDDPDDIRWLDDGRVEYDVGFVADFGDFSQKIRVCGTNTVTYVTRGVVDSMGLFSATPTSQGSQSYYIAATPNEGTPDEIEQRLLFQEKMADDLLVDDTRAFRNMRFVEGAFVGEDRHLMRWFRHARGFPTRDLDALFG